MVAEYTVLSLDFQGIGNAGFATEEDFVQAFCRLVKRAAGTGLEIPDRILTQMPPRQPARTDAYRESASISSQMDAISSGPYLWSQGMGKMFWARR